MEEPFKNRKQEFSRMCRIEIDNHEDFIKWGHEIAVIKNITENNHEYILEMNEWFPYRPRTK